MKWDRDNWLELIGLRRPGEAELRLHPFTLRFSGEMRDLEKAFLTDYFDRTIGHFRFALILAVIFYAGFAFLDAAIIPVLKYQFWFIRFVMVIPVLITVYFLTYARTFRKYMQPVVTVTMYWTGLGIILMTIFAGRHDLHTYYAGLILIFFFGYTISRLQFVYATIAGWSIVLSYELAAIFLADAPPQVLGNNSAFFISANIVGMVVCYIMEYSTRKDFYMRLLLENEKEKVNAANESLEKRVQERTAQLTRANRNLKKEIEMRKHYQEEQAKLEAQLLQLQKMETIGTLAGGIAHDFNNILTPVLGYTEMALEELNDDSNLRYDIEQIHHAALRGKDLVQQILTFSRQMDVDKKPLQLHLVIKEALNLVKASFPANIEIRQQLDPRCGTVLADNTQIHQILMNLCTNSYHAMMDKGGVLEVKLHKTEVDPKLDKSLAHLNKGTYIVITVTDTGHGMDQETMLRIFEPFFTKKEVGVGSGLGLSVVHGIVKSYKGAITVDSMIGKGTIFKIYLPQHSADLGITKGPAEKVIKGKEHILFIDDEEEITFMGKKMLESLGYTVNIETNPLRALDVFMQSPEEFDLLVTDQTMPNMLGTDLALKFREVRPELKIIIITGFTDSINREIADENGINEFIFKPLILSEFSKVIREVLDGKVKQNA
jgi:signal transduction histidine kinase/ActR/RegA family two-component response regulator